MELKDLEKIILDFWFDKYGRMQGWKPTPRTRREIEELAKKIYDSQFEEELDYVPYN
jgi:hypothetical protein